MLRVYSAKQLQDLDHFTIQNEPIKSIDLMERAANEIFNWLKKNILLENPKSHFSIFCGLGNNGGDGLALARLLSESGIEVVVYLIELSQDYSENLKTNLNLFKGSIVRLKEDDSEFELTQDSIIIDAIFGSGLNRSVDGFTAQIIRKINAHQAFVISIDVPSGLFIEDNTNNNLNAIIHAKITLSIQLPKLAFFFPENSKFVGEWHLLNINLSPQFINDTPSNYHFLQIQDCKQIIKDRSKFSHKGTYGHALILAGSKGKMGASVLAARACLRAGVGLLTVQVPACGEVILQTAVPEAMVAADNQEEVLSELKSNLKFTSLGIGPGIGLASETMQVVKRLIQENNGPMVFDADALNILAENKTWLSFLPKNCIFTPHPVEFKRLVGDWESDFQRLELQIQLSRKISGYIVLKGKNTSISTPSGKVFFNSTGNPGMATGGSGDVLTGMLTSLLAQGYSSLESCILGVYLHGLAGDIAADKNGMESLTASDIIDSIGMGFQKIKNSN